MKVNFRIFCLFLALPGFLFAAEPKEFTALITCSPSEASTAQFADWTALFEKNENDAMAETFRNWKEGWFGSGLLIRVKEAEGENLLIVTNKHVTLNSASMAVQFLPDSEQGRELKESCPVFTDPDLDLALIDIPDAWAEGLPALGLPFSEELHDGEDVYAAGYPGLFGKPVWQLSKGVVSNHSAAIDQIISSEITSLIQHSAAVDPGNSGGPLLKKEGESWLPAGINTWSIRNRNDTYFAIPIHKVSVLVKNYGLYNGAERAAYLKKSLIRRMEALTELLNSSEWPEDFDESFISEAYVLDHGFNAYLSLVNQEAEEQEALFVKGHGPMDILKSSVGWWAWSKWQTQKKEKIFTFDRSVMDKDSLASCLANAKEDSVAKVPLLLEKKEYNAEFILKEGIWLLKSLDFAFPIKDRKIKDAAHKAGSPKKKAKKKRKADVDDISLGVLFDAVPPFLNKDMGDLDLDLPGWGLGITMNFPVKDYFAYNTGIAWRSMKMESSSSYWGSSEKKEASFSGLAGEAGISGGYPFGKGASVFYPFGAASISFAFGSLKGISDEGLTGAVMFRFGGGLKYMNLNKSFLVSLGMFNERGKILSISEELPSLNHVVFRAEVHWLMR